MPLSAIDRQPEHDSELPRSFDLAAICQVGGEAYRVATFVTSREVRPSARCKVDLETAKPPIAALGIARAIFPTLNSTAWQPACQEIGQPAERGAVDRGEIDAAG